MVQWPNVHDIMTDDFAMRYALIYLGVNSRAELVTLHYRYTAKCTVILKWSNTFPYFIFSLFQILKNNWDQVFVVRECSLQLVTGCRSRKHGGHGKNYSFIWILQLLQLWPTWSIWRWIMFRVETWLVVFHTSSRTNIYRKIYVHKILC